MIRIVTFCRPSGTSRLEMILAEILNPLLTSHDIMAAAATAVMQQFKAQVKSSQDKNWLTSKLQQVESCSWLEEDRSTYLLTCRYVRLYRFVFGIVRNQSHQSIMDVVMNERTAELYTHWVEKISELATCRKPISCRPKAAHVLGLHLFQCLGSLTFPE